MLQNYFTLALCPKIGHHGHMNKKEKPAQPEGGAGFEVKKE